MVPVSLGLVEAEAGLRAAPVAAGVVGALADAGEVCEDAADGAPVGAALVPGVTGAVVAGAVSPAAVLLSPALSVAESADTPRRASAVVSGAAGSEAEALCSTTSLVPSPAGMASALTLT